MDNTMAIMTGAAGLVAGAACMAATSGPAKPAGAKLSYFDGPGKAEGTRLMCAYAGLKLEDVRLTRPMFLFLKHSGHLPYGQVPLLEVGGEKIGQSSAIIRTLGKMCGKGLYPADAARAGVVDALIDQEIDMTMGISCSNYQPRFGFDEVLGGPNPESANTKTVRKAINDKILPVHLAKFELAISRGGTGWLAGTPAPTIADFVLVPRLQWLHAGGVPGIGGDRLFKDYPGVVALMDKLMALPAVMRYYAGIRATCKVGPAGKPCGGGAEAAAACTGTIELEQLDAATVRIRYDLKGAGDGLHGFHIHEKADFSNGCLSTGPHYNPFGVAHGGPTDAVRHVGDLGNLEFKGGACKGELVDSLVKLYGQTSVLGRSFMVHALPDDLGKGDSSEIGTQGKTSRTTGNAGARIACGEIIKVVDPAWQAARGIVQAELELNTKNQAFVFIKPHANTPATKKLVSELLTSKGLAILKEGTITAEEIDSKKLIDQHYYAIASKATILKPAQLNVPADKFEAQFGVGWQAALDAGSVFNAIDACAELGLDADGLDVEWGKAKKAGKLIKFGGGFYCGLVEVAGKKPIYVFNGFFMTMRTEFTKPGLSISYFKVEWDAATLPWADFRGKLLGPTDPADAPVGSARGQILAKWKELGLAEEPNVGLNGVHASASPFEAMAEFSNWLEEPLADIAHAQTLMAAGIPSQTLERWSVDPQVPGGGADGSKQKGSLFDALEDTDAVAGVEKCVTLSQM